MLYDSFRGPYNYIMPKISNNLNIFRGLNIYIFFKISILSPGIGKSIPISNDNSRTVKKSVKTCYEKYRGHLNKKQKYLDRQ